MNIYLLIAPVIIPDAVLLRTGVLAAAGLAEDDVGVAADAVQVRAVSQQGGSLLYFHHGHRGFQINFFHVVKDPPPNPSR